MLDYEVETRFESVHKDSNQCPYAKNWAVKDGNAREVFLGLSLSRSTLLNLLVFTTLLSVERGIIPDPFVSLMFLP